MAEVQFNPLAMSLGDIEAMEQGFGVKMGDLMKMFSGKKKFDLQELGAREMLALAFVVKRCMGEKITPDQVRELTLDGLISSFDGMEVPVVQDPPEGG